MFVECGRTCIRKDCEIRFIRLNAEWDPMRDDHFCAEGSEGSSMPISVTFKCIANGFQTPSVVESRRHIQS